MNGSKIVKKFVVAIILELKKRHLLTDVLASSGISPFEWTYIKELFNPFEDGGME